MLFVMLAPGSLNHTANIIKGFAIAIGVAMAIGFVWMWWSARLKERRLELTGKARSAFAAHLRFAMQHPEMSEPMLGVISSPVEIVRYKQFVANLLATAEEVLLYDSGSDWQTALARQLAPHRSYLASEEFQTGPYGDCSAAVKSLIQKTIGA